MSEAAALGSPTPWEAAGEKAAPSSGGKAALVIVADDPADAAAVALGIGRIEARHRRVAIADLVGELPALQRFVTGDDPHGISDSFNFGVSLNRIAYPVEGADQLFVMPSGTEVVQTAAIFASPRWCRLASGFREVGALLLIVAPAGADGLEDLIAATDGVIALGDVQLPGDSHVVARLAIPGRAERTPAAVPADAAAPAAGRPSRAAAGTATHRRSPPREPARSRWIALAAAVAITGALWTVRLYWTERAGGQPAGPPAASEISADGAVAPADSVTAGSVTGDSAAAIAAPASDASGAAADDAALPAPALVINAVDSAAAAAWGVEIVATNTQSGAIFKLIEEAGVLPAATYSPVSRGGERLWFHVVSGAFTGRTSADSLLRALRANGTLARQAGRLRNLPYALLVETGVSRENAPALVAALVAREVPAYALLQADGSASLYAGAFESPDQTGLLAAALRSRGIEPKLVYRIGRPF